MGIGHEHLREHGQKKLSGSLNFQITGLWGDAPHPTAERASLRILPERLKASYCVQLSVCLILHP